MRQYKELRRDYGRSTVVAYPIRKHVRQLLDSGLEMTAIEKMANVAHGTMNDLMGGRTKRLYERTADNLRMVQPGDWRENARVPAAVAVQVLDEIVAAGVQQKSIAEAFGYRHPHLSIRYRRFVTQRTYRRLLVVAAHCGVRRPIDVLPEVAI